MQYKYWALYSLTGILAFIPSSAWASDVRRLYEHDYFTSFSFETDDSAGGLSCFAAGIGSLNPSVKASEVTIDTRADGKMASWGPDVPAHVVEYTNKPIKNYTIYGLYFELFNRNATTKILSSFEKCYSPKYNPYKLDPSMGILSFKVKSSLDPVAISNCLSEWSGFTGRSKYGSEGSVGLKLKYAMAGHFEAEWWNGRTMGHDKQRLPWLDIVESDGNSGSIISSYWRINALGRIIGNKTPFDENTFDYASIRNVKESWTHEAVLYRCATTGTAVIAEDLP